LLLTTGLKVRHPMTRTPLPVPPSASIERVKQVMAASRVHHLLVCDGDRLLGVVSDRDLSDGNGTAGQIMHREVHSVTPATGLGGAIHALIEKNISCLPVLEGDRLCGILSTTDLVLTLECSLQLWLRMAQALRSGGSWAAEFKAFSQAVRREVAVHQEQLSALRGLLVPGEPDNGQRRGEAFVERAAAFVAAASRLADQLDSAQDRLRQTADQWIATADEAGTPSALLDHARSVLTEGLAAGGSCVGLPASSDQLAHEMPAPSPS